VVEQDRYGRIVAKVFSPDGVDLGRRLVSAGWALAYRRYSADYVDAEAEARKAERGMWRGTFVRPLGVARNGTAATRDLIEDSNLCDRLSRNTVSRDFRAIQQRCPDHGSTSWTHPALEIAGSQATTAHSFPGSDRSRWPPLSPGRDHAALVRGARSCEHPLA
jgi:Staphylococcal nuclease homologue